MNGSLLIQMCHKRNFGIVHRNRARVFTVLGFGHCRRQDRSFQFERSFRGDITTGHGRHLRKGMIPVQGDFQIVLSDLDPAAQRGPAAAGKIGPKRRRGEPKVPDLRR